MTRYNALFHWEVPPGREIEAGREVGRHYIMTHAYWREGGPEFRGVNIMAVAHGTEKDTVLAHKAAIDEHLREAGIAVRLHQRVLGRPQRDQAVRDRARRVRRRSAPTHGLDPEAMRCMIRRAARRERASLALALSRVHEGRRDRRARPAAAPRAAPSGPHPTGSVIVEAADPKNLNPAFASASPALELSVFIFSYTVRYDDKAQPVPDAVTEIPTLANGDVSKDGLTLKYKLRHNIKWHDGAAS